MGIYYVDVARLATTTDIFNAIAEPQRRFILSLLAQGELPVSAISQTLALKQPQVSKHLRVLKAVDLVSVRKAGKQRIYCLNSDKLQPVHEWIESFSHLWTERFDRLEAHLETVQGKDKV